MIYRSNEYYWNCVKSHNSTLFDDLNNIMTANGYNSKSDFDYVATTNSDATPTIKAIESLTKPNWYAIKCSNGTNFNEAYSAAFTSSELLP